MLVSETRRQEILEKLQRERERRRELIEQGNQQPYIDHHIVEQAQLGHVEQEESFNDVQDLPDASSRLAEQRAKLQEMKKQLFDRRKGSDSAIERLAQPKSYDELERMKQEKEDIKLKQCTFQPQISDQSKLISAIKYTQYEGDDLVTRFNLLEKERQQHIEELRNQKADSVQPQAAKSVEGVPLHLRLADVVKQKQAHLQYLQQKQLDDEQSKFDFRPQINPQSEVMALIKYEGVNVIDRLTKPSVSQYQKEEYSFHPSVNHNEEMLQHLSTNFLERQQQLLRVKTQRLVAIEEQVAAEQTCTFHPRVDPLSQQLTRGKRPDDVVERLFNHERPQPTYEDSFPFAPAIDPKSRKLAQDRTLADLMHEDPLRKEQLRKEAEEQHQSECSFYPSTCSNPRYSNIQSPYTFDNCSEVIKSHQQQKETLRRQKQQQREADELQGCTFKPSINSKSSAHREPLIEVNGLTNYIQKVDQLNKIKQDKRAREEKLFEMHRQYDPQKHQVETTPQPFNLSNGPQPAKQYSQLKKK